MRMFKAGPAVVAAAAPAQPIGLVSPGSSLVAEKVTAAGSASKDKAPDHELASGTSYLLVRDASGLAGIYDLQQPQCVEQLSRRCGRPDVPPVCDAWWVRDFGQPEALRIVVTRTGLDSFAGGDLVWSFVDADWQTIARVVVR